MIEMKDVTDPTAVTDLILGLDGTHDDGPDLFVDVRPGGQATTSASCEVILEDPSSGARQAFRVEVTVPEEEEAVDG